MHKVVLDTNILVSSLLAPGTPASIVDLIAQGRVIPYYTDLILEKYWDVLLREKFGFTTLQVSRLVDDIVKAGFAVESVSTSIFKMTDEDDRIFYDTAVKAAAYLVTGNAKHFPAKPFVVAPVQFLTIYQNAG